LIKKRNLFVVALKSEQEIIDAGIRRTFSHELDHSKSSLIEKNVLPFQEKN